MIGRRCNVEGGEVVWPTVCNKKHFPEQCWKGDIIVHPAIGRRARRSKLIRGVVPVDIRRLARIWELSMGEDGDFSRILPTWPQCISRGLGDRPRRPGYETEREGS
eukprot:5129779-Pyramimonas_sp.AAC.1